VLILYATGIGKLTTSVASGNAAPTSPLASSVDPATITIRIQEAVARSQEGQRASARMRSRWEAPLAELEKRDTYIKAERESLDRESKRQRGVWPFRHAMRAKGKAKRSRAIDRKAEDVSRERARIQAAVSEEQRRVVGDIARRLIPLLESYAREHGYSLVLDTGQENGPVVVALNDITDEIVRLFDRAFPASFDN
jgi:Skp family chaperone for outer membrane proteins